MIDVIVAILLSLFGAIAPEPATLNCWEDEVVVVVVKDNYGLIGRGTYGCVPADNLPVNGHRP